MTAFICINCGYKFESEEGKKCPYCASENIEKEKTANELVDNVRAE